MSGQLHSDRRLQFIYLSLDIFRRHTNVESLAVDHHKQQKGRHPPNFVINRKIEDYHSKLLQLDFDLEASELKQLDFIWPNTNKKINAAIWSLSEEDRVDVHNKATNCQRKFLYLPLHVLQKETNIYQLVQAFEESQGNDVAGANLERHVAQVHKQLAEVESWPQFLSGLKFLSEVSNDDKGMLSKTSTESDFEAQSARLSRKRKEGSNQTDESGSVPDKKPKIHANAVNSKIPVRHAHQDVHQLNNDDTKHSTSSVEPVTPSTMNMSTSQPTSKMVQKGSTIKKRVVPEPSDFQREIIAMSYDDFVEKTNVAQLVATDFARQFNGTKEMEPSHMDWGLKEYDRLRNLYEKWHVNSLKNLKFKECECKRKKTFADKATHTDDAEVQDMGIQCSLSDFNRYETDELEQHLRQSKMALPTVNAISESQIIISTQYDVPESQRLDQNDSACVTDDVFNVNEAEEDNQPSQVAPRVETPTESPADSSPEASEVATQPLLQSAGLQSPERRNQDHDGANVTDDVTVNETEKDNHLSQVAPDTESLTKGRADSSPKASEVATQPLSQSVANNDAITVAIENSNSTQNVRDATAVGIENVNVNQTARAENRSKHLKHKKTPRKSAVRSILREIGQHFESLRAPTSDLNRKVDLCMAMARRN
ncbi:uncharacterized protein LOC129565137 [Sitodiplosis mosellana]|uniref:uncharacterized protein LOC129565137 n=1 Tax=Sitodiplosis mosellana TaxID=263140 RepID=UPI00244511DB|nr:uncharacterized protein LOC129565137 [Sitodiplosis mosellana]